MPFGESLIGRLGGMAMHTFSTPSALALTVILSIFIYTLALGIYRLTLHPLAKYPGPKLAGLTHWYMFYYDVVQPGQYIFKIEDMQKIYGPIIRIAPNELHVGDPEFFAQIYHSKAHRTQRDAFYIHELLGTSVTFTVDHDVHARRRASLANYFSMTAIRALEERIATVVMKMMDKMHQAMLSDNIIDLRYLYTALTVDIISEYLLGESNGVNFMSKPEYGKEWVVLSDEQMPFTFLFIHLKFIFRLFTRLPLWLVLRLSPSAKVYIDHQDKLMQRIETDLRTINSTNNKADISKETNLIAELITSPELQPRDKTALRLRDEAGMIFSAGSETTMTVLTRLTFYLIDSPQILSRLRQELKAALPDARTIPTLNVVGQLPYLNAVIEEGLRISTPVIGRIPRIFEDHTLVYKDWSIPPGTSISASTWCTLMNPTIFPDPTTFNPDRWLNNPDLLRYQVAFSKGRRGCIGMNLAYTELRIAIAAIFRRFELELYETTRKDVTAVHDFLVGHAALDSKGVRVRVVRELE